MRGSHGPDVQGSRRTIHATQGEDLHMAKKKGKKKGKKGKKKK